MSEVEDSASRGEDPDLIGEEMKALEESLAEARAEALRHLEAIGEKEGRIRELEEAVEDSMRRATQLQATVEEQGQAITARDEAYREQEVGDSTRRAELALAREQLAAAVAKYRALRLAEVPEVLEELVKGDTVEEVEASLAAAQELVRRVRSQLEAKAAAERVPAGAPVRAAPDLSQLSPREKIAYALSRLKG